MSLLHIESPYDVYYDINGQPLDSGMIWIGEAGKPAESNPIDVYWDDELQRPASQPIRTLNGYMSDNGTAGKPKVPYAFIQNFSITVRNNRGELIYSTLSGVTGLTKEIEDATVTATSVKNTAAVRSLPVIKDQGVYRQCHKLMYDGGGLHFVGRTNAGVGTFSDNNGTVIVPIGGDGSAAWVCYDQVINSAAFGANYLVNDVRAPLVDAIEYAARHDIKLILAGGDLKISGVLSAYLAGSLDMEVPANTRILKSGLFSGDILDFTVGHSSYKINVHGGGEINDKTMYNGYDGNFIGPAVSGGNSATTGYVLFKDSSGNEIKLATIA